MDYKIYQQKRLELTKIKDEGMRIAAASALEYVFLRDLEKIRPNLQSPLINEYTPEQLAFLQRDAQIYERDSCETRKIMESHKKIFTPYDNSSEIKAILTYELKE